MIERERLYGVGGAYHALPFADLRRVSLSLHKEKRRAHAQGVSDTAVLLAKKYGADETDAARAGILHDITKALSPAQQQKLVDHWKLPVSPFEYAQTKLLHAKTGAAAAARIFGENNAVTSAIDYHTTGRAHMTLLEKSSTLRIIWSRTAIFRALTACGRLSGAIWTRACCSAST